MIEVAGLTKEYGGVKAVDGLTFTAPPGTVTGFLGPNGAGKTTTMRLVLGLDRPTAGTARVCGRPYRRLDAPMRAVGALLGTESVPGGMTAAAHLRWLARAGGLPRRRVGEVLDTVGLGDAAGRKVKGFSLGMRQRLGLAAALLGDPGVLVLDEPVNGLDPEGVRWIRNLLRRLAAEGRTVLLSSHLLSETAATADRAVVIGGGRLIADTSIDVLARRGSGPVRAATPRPDLLAGAVEGEGGEAERGPGERVTVRGLDADRVGELAARHGAVLHELYQESPGLEEVFFELTRGSARHTFSGDGTGGDRADEDGAARTGAKDATEGESA